MRWKRPVTIRWARPDDRSLIQEWAVGRAVVPPWLVVENPLILIAERDMRPQAAISLTWGPWGYGTIDWVVRAPGDESRGLGRELVYAALAVLRSKGLQAVSAIAREDETRIRAFHRSFAGVVENQARYVLLWKRFGGDDGQRQ